MKIVSRVIEDSSEIQSLLYRDPRYSGLAQSVRVIAGQSAAAASNPPGASTTFPLPKVSDIQDAWISLLSQWRFDWFCTLTFKDSTHPEAAIKRFGKWISIINTRLYGKRYYKQNRSIYWVNAIEFQKRGVIHFHALLGAPEDLNFKLRRLEFMDIWYELAGIARIEAIKSDDAVRSYVTKYVAKGGEIDISPGIREYVQQTKLDLPRW